MTVENAELPKKEEPKYVHGRIQLAVDMLVGQPDEVIIAALDNEMANMRTDILNLLKQLGLLTNVVNVPV